MNAKNKSKNATTLDEWHHLFFSLLSNFNLSHLFMQFVEQEESTKEYHIKATGEQAQLVRQIFILYFSFTILISVFLLL